MKRHNLRPTSKLLVQSILKGDVLSADSLFKKLITEAQEDREAEAAAEVEGEQFEDISFDETDDTELDTAEGEEQTINDSTQTAEEDLSVDTEDELDEELANEKSADLDEDKELSDDIDDIAIIKKGVNQKMVSNLFDKIANMKNAIEGLDLDPESREYITYDYSLNYYSDKLLTIQTKVNEEADQTIITAALDKIKTSLEQLAGEAGIEDALSIDDIKTPNQIKAESGMDIEEQEEAAQFEEQEVAEDNAEQSEEEADIEEIENEVEDAEETDEDEEVEDFEQQS